MTKRTARTNRIAYQIWALIERTGGDCTVFDMAEATGESWQVCVNVCRRRGWSTRYRNTAPGYRCDQSGKTATTQFDDALSDMERLA